MSEKFVYRLRNLAAILISLSGIALVSALWFRELTETAVLDALLGSVYLIIGIGLFGQSRFALFMAILTPAAVSFYLYGRPQEAALVYSLRLCADVLIMFCSTLVLWRVRNNPSV